MWPAADGLPRIHSNRSQGGGDEIIESTRSSMARWIKKDQVLYKRAVARFGQKWNALVEEADRSGFKSIPEFLNARHKIHFFAVQSPIEAFDLSAARA